MNVGAFFVAMITIESKDKLLETCRLILVQKIALSKNAMDEAQRSANNEEKSTAGDKHDTARAMAHLDRDMNARQLAELIDTIKMLDSIGAMNNKHSYVRTGSLVVTSAGNYFLAVSIGKITLDSMDFFVISPMAPVAQLLLNKKASDQLKFNGRDIIIHDVY